MALRQLQERVDDWISQYEIGYFEPLEIIARLAEETGELAREVNHRFGPKKKKEGEDDVELSDEIADVIFTVVCLANSLDLDLDRAFERVMDKCYERDVDRWKKRE